MQYKFFALISRMRYIARWGLMRNTFQENIQEHSHMVAVLAHALALIERDILGGSADPDRCATNTFTACISLKVFMKVNVSSIITPRSKRPTSRWRP